MNPPEMGRLLMKVFDAMAYSPDYTPDERDSVSSALLRLVTIWEAAVECDNASRHVDVCDIMVERRGCSCGHDDLAHALRVLAEQKP